MSAALLALAALLAAAPSKPAAPRRPRVAVLELRAVSADPQAAAVLSEVALTTAGQVRGVETIGPSDVVALLGFEKQKQLLGCKDDAACMADLAGALGADYVLTGTLGKLGNTYRLDLKLLEARRARVLERFGDSQPEVDLLVGSTERGVERLVSRIAEGAPPAPSPQAGAPAPGQAAPAPAAPATRKVRFNGRALSAKGLETLGLLERQFGRLADGDYWYDPVNGTSGQWGGPVLAILPPGLELNGPVPPSASGGGTGGVTGVFINGRELHPVDVAGLMELLGAVYPGRWWVDAQGNYGPEGSPMAMGNLVVIANMRRQQGGGGRQPWSKRLEGITPGDSMNLASDGTTTCVSVSGYSRCTGE